VEVGAGEGPPVRPDRGARTFGELIERYDREILAYALRLTGRRADAEDLFQETFLAAFRAWPPPRRGNERAWLYRIATNKAVDGERRRRPAVSIDDLAPAAPERDGVTMLDLAAAVRVLPAGQRAAFVLHAVNGHPYTEVAQVLGCTEEAARARVSEAMKKVRRALQ
jgi:RNA polymerase sigma-70 factor (ECF subfamily)